MKHVLIALLITLFLLVGGVALTFGFQVPEDTPRVFTMEDAEQDEMAYRAEVVRSAEELISAGINLLMAKRSQGGAGCGPPRTGQGEGQPHPTRADYRPGREQPSGR